jgi:aspartyl-tRNA synthetase
LRKVSKVKFPKKTHNCGTLRIDDVGKQVVLAGWVHRRRDHGGLIFIDLRDRSGLVQTVVTPDCSEAFKIAQKLRSEYVIEVKGQVRARPPGTVNPDLPTGEVEVEVEQIYLVNKSKTPPFELDQTVDETLRLRYRYLDLRRPEMVENLTVRHKIVNCIRSYLDKQGFLEIETPILTKSTPEGARDFLVPSRLQPGHFYALPQSPQLFKQILMISGLEKYYQIARCFRDEDLRADRQLEHTQVDIEMSFVDRDDILTLVEGLLQEVFKTLNINIKTPFLRLSYEEAMARYGTDKPDLRFDLQIQDVSSVFANTEFKVFKQVLDSEGVIRCLKAPGGASFSRAKIDELVLLAQKHGAKGLAWLEVAKDDSLKSPIAKFLSDQEKKNLIKFCKAKEGDLLLIVADKLEIASVSLGVLRLKLARELDLIQENEFKLLWIVDFPLFEWDEEEEKLKSHHHPFTMPTLDSLDLLEKNPLAAKAYAYDIIINGIEIGGGSLRIYDPQLQTRIFNLLGLSKEEAKDKFGFLLEAFNYGAPPHGGIALGLDRLIMILLGRATIRDVIAFPKTQTGSDLMTGAPDRVTPKQLKELHIKMR